MPASCCACSTLAKFLVKDGGHKKPACTYHAQAWDRDTNNPVTIIRPLYKEERE